MSFRWLPWHGTVRALVIAGVLCSTTASTYLLMRDNIAPEVVQRFQSLSKPAHTQRPEWAPRVGALALAKAIYNKSKKQEIENIARMYAAAFFLTGLIYVALNARAAPFMSLGTFAAISYCNTPHSREAWCPWDMPVLVLSAACLLLAIKRKVIPLALVALAAIAFKETLVLMVLFVLFYEDRSWRFRLGWAGGTLAAGVLLRVGIERWLKHETEHSSFLHLKGDPEAGLRIFHNLKTAFNVAPNHVLFVNAGLWALIFLIPTQDRVLSGMRWIALAVYGGLLLAGNFREFRVFLEVLPGALFLAYGLLASERAEPRPVPR